MKTAELVPEIEAATSDKELVNYVVEFMREQGKPAVGRVLGCVNVTEDGARCAIACCFSPEAAKKHSNVDLQEMLVGRGFSSHAVSGLLSAHDRTANTFPPAEDFFPAFLKALKDRGLL